MNTRALHVVVCAAAVLAAGSIADAAVRIVRTGATYTSLHAAVDAAISGDTIEIDSGTYVGAGAMATIASHKSNITIRGVGPTRPILDANYTGREEKGILVVYGTNTTVENIVFQHARSISGNGAGIRQQGNHLTVRNCRFFDCQNGILGGGAPGPAGYVSDLLVEYSEFDSCGNTGYAHGMYISNIRSFTLQHCYVHHAVGGHEIKTRAGTNYILYNRIANEGGSGSYEVNIANGGTTYIIGNLIEQSPTSPNAIIIDYLSEGTHENNPDQHLYVVSNTIVNNRGNGTFVMNYSNTTNALLQNNIFQGSGTVLNGRGVQISNWFTPNAYLADPANYDYRLTAASIGAIDMGSTPSPSSGANGFSLLPAFQYVHLAGSEARPDDGVIDIGAYEYVNPNQDPTVDAGADLSVREGQRVDLHAVASDPDMDPLTWFWGQVSGAAVSLADETTDAPWFIAPTVTSVQQAEMGFLVAVDDGKGGQATDTVNVRVYMTGDINQDDGVNVIDLLMLAGAWNTTQNDPNWDLRCDLNDDGAVNVLDLLTLANNWTRALN